MGFLPFRNLAICFCGFALSAASVGCGDRLGTSRPAVKHGRRAQHDDVVGVPSASTSVGLKREAPRPPAVSPTQNQPIQPQLLLRQARAALASHKTVRATIHERIHLYGQELVGKGDVFQDPRRYLLKLDLTLNVDGRDFYVQQRCDGKYYWLQKCVDGIPRVTRVDVRRVEAARAAHVNKTGATNAVGKPASGTTPLPMLGFGGIATLLEQLDIWCDFSKVSQVTLRGASETPVYMLEGTWKPDRLLFWLPDQKSAFEEGRPFNVDKLPAMLPDRVLVFLGRDDLFPRRIDYSVSESRASDATERPPLVRIHFEDIQFDQSGNPIDFTFESSIAAPIDDTDGYLLRHGWQ
jgi:hypothetical protein